MNKFFSRLNEREQGKGGKNEKNYGIYAFAE